MANDASPTVRSSGRRAATARAAWGTISREQVIDEALRIVQARGYEALTVRELSAALGVAPMSLYRHVRNKDDLLDEIVDRLLAAAWQPRANESDWRRWLTQAADRLRRFLVQQPAALRVYLTHPVISPAAVARMEAMLRVLRDVTADEAAARKAYAAIHTYTIGFAALEASRADWKPTRTAPRQPLADQLAAYTTPRQFSEGLGYLLDAIETRGSGRTP
jgi:TetR/AcrR family tetracycline transcriptional repressor